MHSAAVLFLLGFPALACPLMSMDFTEALVLLDSLWMAICFHGVIDDPRPSQG